MAIVLATLCVGAVIALGITVTVLLLLGFTYDPAATMRPGREHE